MTAWFEQVRFGFRDGVVDISLLYTSDEKTPVEGNNLALRRKCKANGCIRCTLNVWKAERI
jgi:hypothetical protein